jgi:hypothetical protein
MNITKLLLAALLISLLLVLPIGSDGRVNRDKGADYFFQAEELFEEKKYEQGGPYLYFYI